MRELARTQIAQSAARYTVPVVASLGESLSRRAHSCPTVLTP